MKVKFLLLFFLIIFSGLSFSNSIDSTKVGPGVVYYHEVRDSGPWQFDILKIDLTQSMLKLETIKSQDRLRAFERTSSMAARNDYEKHRVVGAINGDFYNTSNGEPINTQVINGQILKNPGSYVSVGFNGNNKPMIDAMKFSGTVIAGDSTREINSVNGTRSENYLVLYNPFFGNGTGTNQYGSEAVITPITNWVVNDTVIVVVDTVRTGVGNILIPGGKAVLSGHGTASSFLVNNFHKGDTLKLALSLLPSLPKLMQSVGGNTRLVTDGAANPENGDRHPRTAVGFSKDSLTLYFFTVDGRQAGFSVGMSYKELGEYMIEWGVYQGINLDGGGSTTMVVRGEVKNSPSDPGGERSVANSLQIISTAPTGDLSHLSISPKKVFVLAASSAKFTVKGFDEYYNPINFNASALTWSCDPKLGIIDQTGLLTTAEGDTTTGYIYVENNGIVDSAMVVVTQISSIKLQPDPIILQPGQTQAVLAEARDSYNNIIELPNNSYTWSVNGGLGTITIEGVFTAVSLGDGSITAQYKTITGSTPVFVGLAAENVIDDFSSTSNFSLTGTKVDLGSCTFTADTSVYISEPSSGKLQYSLTTGGTSALYLNCSIPISGTPDAVGLSIYGDGKAHWLRGEFADADNEKFLIDFTSADPGINWNGSWKNVMVSLDKAVASWANPNAVLNFPIKWTRIYLAETADAKKDAGAIYLDDFTSYYTVTGVKDDNNSSMPRAFNLRQNYPNPFNPSTIISFEVPEASHVKITVYDILGNEVAALVNGVKQPGSYSVQFDAFNLSSGIYFYKMQANGYINSKKMLILK